MAIAAVPLVASVKVCSLILFLAVAVSLACNPMDIYSPPQTKTATTTTERPMTWSTMMDSEEEGANKESSVGREAEHNGPQLSENSSDNGGASASMNWAILREKMIDDASKRVNITCAELRNATFTNAPPFDVLGVPECGEAVQPELVLYLPKNNSSCEIETANLPNESTDKCLGGLRADATIRKLVIVIHGFTKAFDTEWMHEMQRDIMRLDPGTAVVIVGWGHGVADIFHYYRAAANTRYIARAMYLAVKEVHRIVSDRRLYVHCVGHSLGAHACGFLGKHLIADPAGTSQELDRISGMDPAGPLFCNDVPYPFDGLNVKPTARLGPHDANLVQAIHTDGQARWVFSILPQYGTMEQLGTIDFYPGAPGYYGHDQPGCYDVFNVVSCSHSRSIEIFQSSIVKASCLAGKYGTLEQLGTIDFYPGAPGYYGHDQPGCYDVFNIVSCSHHRSIEIFLSSIVTATCLAGKECHGDPHHIPKNCMDIIRYAEVVTMGYWWDPDEADPGLYTVDVTSKPPFCEPPKIRTATKVAVT